MKYDQKEVAALRDLVKESGSTIADCARRLNIPVARAYQMLYRRKATAKKAYQARKTVQTITRDISDFLDPAALDSVALKLGREMIKNYVNKNFS